MTTITFRGLRVNMVWRRSSAVALASVLLLGGCSRESPQQLLSSAKTLIAKNDNKAAIIQLKNALQKNASLPEARFLLGKSLLETGDIRGAMVELNKAEELGYSRDELAPRLAAALLLMSEPGKVVSRFGQTSLGTAAATSELKTTVAAAYAALNKLAQARESVDTALKLDPSNVGAQLINVRLLTVENKPALALIAMDESIAARPDHSNAWLLKGELLQAKRNDDPAAKVAYEKALDLDKGNLGAYSALIVWNIQRKNIPEAKRQLDLLSAQFPNFPQTRYFKALVALESKDLNIANEHIQQLLKVAPDNPRALYLAGVIDFQRGAFLQAEANLNKALLSRVDTDATSILLARTQLRLGDPNKALASIQRLLGGEHVSAEAYALAGEAQLQMGDTELGQNLLAKAATLNPSDYRTRTVLAVANLSGGKDDRGLEDLRAIAANDSGTTGDLALIGEYFKRNDIPRALKAVDNLERKIPGAPVAANLRGRIELTRGNRDRARQAFEAALKIAPTFFPSVASLATMDIDERKPELALQRFERVLSVDPKNLQAQLAAIGLRSEMGMADEQLIDLAKKAVASNPSEASPYLALVRVYLDRNEAKNAVTTAQQGLAASPENTDLLDALGRSQVAAGDVQQALVAFNKITNLQPNSPLPYQRIADIHIAAGDNVAALQSLRRALKLRPNYLPAQTSMLRLDVAAARFAEARKMVRNVQTQRPNEPIGYSLEGDLELALKNWPAARIAFNTSMNKRPTTEVVLKMLSAFEAEGLQAEARKLEEKWLAEHPNDINFLVELGNLALSRSNFPQAERHFLAVLALQPNNVPILNNLAWTLRRSARPGALEYAEKANKLSPNQPSILDTLADIHAAAGQWEKAISIQSQAVKLGPDMHVHRLHLAQFYVGANRKTEARAELNRLADLGDQFRGQAEVQKILSSL